MSFPNRTEMLQHLREHYGLTISEVMQFVNIPIHPFEMRDDFARAALTGIISTSAAPYFGIDSSCAERIAKNAYNIADAMLEARIKKDETHD